MNREDAHSLAGGRPQPASSLPHHTRTHTRTPAHPHARTPAHPHTRTPAACSTRCARARRVVRHCALVPGKPVAALVVVKLMMCLHLQPLRAFIHLLIYVCMLVGCRTTAASRRASTRPPTRLRRRARPRTRTTFTMVFWAAPRARRRRRRQRRRPAASARAPRGTRMAQARAAAGWAATPANRPWHKMAMATE